MDKKTAKNKKQAARKRGIARSAWIQYTLSKALDEESGV
jgi:hypothetical protein